MHMHCITSLICIQKYSITQVWLLIQKINNYHCTYLSHFKRHFTNMQGIQTLELELIGVIDCSRSRYSLSTKYNK